MKLFILVLYFMAPTDPRLDRWSDGFQQALQIIQQTPQFTIKQLNVFDSPKEDLNKYDLVLVKGGFNGKVHEYAKNFFQNNNDKKTKVGICISTIAKPTHQDLHFYDVLFYETEWYKQYAGLDRHNNIFHAFGIDKSIMKNMNIKKKYDYIFIGNTKYYKRPERFLEKKGNNIAIAQWFDKNIEQKFKDKKILTLDFVTQQELANYYNLSKTLYIPATIDGGGERALLEARACGINVEIEKDNLKLKELLTSPIYGAHYYANQLIKGIRKTCLK